jgi:amino acid permease
MYKHETDNISSFLNKPLHEHPGPTPIIIIIIIIITTTTTLFWSKKTSQYTLSMHLGPTSIIILIIFVGVKNSDLIS